MKKHCDYCGKKHSGSYGSGRFCNEKCARGYSTKDKREVINKKVSERMKGRMIGGIPGRKRRKLIRKKCPICNHNFSTRKVEQELCSKRCSSIKGGRNPKPGVGGIREGGGHSKLIDYYSPIAGSMKLNQEEIRLAKVFDDLKLNWKRNWVGFPYIDLKGRKRNFYPDFYVFNFDYYIEYKGWVTEEQKHKMCDAKRKNKLNLLIIYGNEYRYRNLGLNISSIEKKPEILIGNMV